MDVAGLAGLGFAGGVVPEGAAGAEMESRYEFDPAFEGVAGAGPAS